MLTATAYVPRRKRPTPIVRPVTIVLAVALSMTAAVRDAHAEDHANAHAARTLSVKDTAHLREVRRPGGFLIEEGYATGTLAGTVRASMILGATVQATVTIFPAAGGSITGHGSGELKGNPAEPSFGGHLTITSGTGRYAHARGSGGIYGVLKRRTFSVTVTAIGKLSY